MQPQAFHGKVAHGAGHGNINLILDGAGVAAVTHSQEALAVVRARRNEQDVRTRLADLARHLGKFDVVADEDSDDAELGAEYL